MCEWEWERCEVPGYHAGKIAPTKTLIWFMFPKHLSLALLLFDGHWAMCYQEDEYITSVKARWVCETTGESLPAGLQNHSKTVPRKAKSLLSIVICMEIGLNRQKKCPAYTKTPFEEFQL
jgi:hypothetical protein